MKYIAISVIILFYIVTGLLLKIFLTKDNHQKIITQISKWYSTLFLKVMNIKLIIKGTLNHNFEFIIANHVSSIDIPIIASLTPSRFITSTDLENDGLAGYISKAAGCIIVNRKSIKTIKSENNNIAKLVHNHCPLVLFPESTSSNGEGILPFKAGLMPSLILSKSRVQPITLNYKILNNEKVTSKNRDSIFYYGEMSFISHLKAISKIKKLEIEVTLHDLIYSTDINEPRVLANTLYQKVSSSYVPITENKEEFIC